MSGEELKIKICIVGDGEVKEFLQEYTQPPRKDDSSYDTPHKEVIDGTIIELTWDYSSEIKDNAKLFILIFSIISPTSLKQIREIYYPEIRKTHPNIPFILLGVQTECRNNEDELKKLKSKNLAPIMKKDAKKLAKELKALKYFELSTNNYEETNYILNLVIKIAYYGRLRKRDQIRKLLHHNKNNNNNNDEEMYEMDQL